MDDVGRGPIALDSVSFIYFIEDDPRFVPVLLPLFEAFDSGSATGHTSEITLLEVLVMPYRRGDMHLAERYELLLTRSRGLTMTGLGRTQLRTAAKLRALHSGLRTPDALQLATALTAGCSTFVTNDRKLPAIDGLRIIQLSTYLRSPRK